MLEMVSGGSPGISEKIGSSQRGWSFSAASESNMRTPEVCRPEVVAPLGDTVGLVHSHQRQGQQRPQSLPQCRRVEPFWSHKDQPQLPRLHAHEPYCIAHNYFVSSTMISSTCLPAFGFRDKGRLYCVVLSWSATVPPVNMFSIASTCLKTNCVISNSLTGVDNPASNDTEKLALHNTNC